MLRLIKIAGGGVVGESARRVRSEATADLDGFRCAPDFYSSSLRACVAELVTCRSGCAATHQDRGCGVGLAGGVGGWGSWVGFVGGVGLAGGDRGWGGVGWGGVGLAGWGRGGGGGGSGAGCEKRGPARCTCPERCVARRVGQSLPALRPDTARRAAGRALGAMVDGSPDLPIGFRGLAPGWSVVRSDVVVHLELVGGRAEADRVDLVGSLPVDPGGDQVVGEDAAGREELVVGLQGVEDGVE